MVDNWAEVTGSNGFDGWFIVGWSHTGETDELVVCDHCGRVVQEDWKEGE